MKCLYLLYPLSWGELREHFGYLTAYKQLEQRIVYGMYHDVINNKGDEEAALKQLGSEVSLNELSNLLGANKDTIGSYIDLLEKTFIIFRLDPFSRNIRNEIKSSRKIYFYDNGIRNAIISNYNPLSIRQDTGALWENFLISERKKCLEYNEVSAASYFLAYYTKAGDRLYRRTKWRNPFVGV